MKFDSKTYQKGKTTIGHVFSPNGANATVRVAGSTTTYIPAEGISSIAHTPGGGVYTITFSKYFPELLGIKPGIALNTAAAYKVVPGAFNAANRTLVLTIYDTNGGAGVVDLAYNANNIVSFEVSFRNDI